MSINKLDNGKYLVQLCFTIDGKRYRPSKTFNTKAECNVWIAEQRLYYKEKEQHKNNMTVREALDKYIEISETLSPTTLRTYKIIREHGFKTIMDRSVWTLDDIIIQEAINEESKRTLLQHPEQTISPKTVANEYALLSAAIFKITKKRFDISLPKRIKKLKKYPHPEEILPLIIGSDIEIPCLMAMCLSLRMSEVRGAKYSDINGRYLYINQVKVYLGKDVVKEDAKTYESNRIVKMPEYLLNLIQSNQDGEYIVKQSQNQLYKRFKALTKDLPYDLTFHSLRHIFASTGAMLGIEPLYLADFGGWSGTKVLESVYESVFDSEKSRAEDTLCNFYDKQITNAVTNKSS